MSETEARRGVLRFFLDTFDDISDDAVPMTSNDRLYTPLIVQVLDDDRRVVAGALACRPQMAAGAAMAHDLFPAVAKQMDVVSELDLIAVRPRARSLGLGSEIIQYMEREPAAREVKVRFGNATQDLDVARLRRFYSRLDFAVLSPGQPVPPLRGVQRVPASELQPAFYFWKAISPADLAGSDQIPEAQRVR